VDQQRHDTILELIDNAIDGTTSADAMRWRPDPDKTAIEGCRCTLCVSLPGICITEQDIARWFDVPPDILAPRFILDPWQMHVIRITAT
jgi:hypothetical protein